MNPDVFRKYPASLLVCQLAIMISRGLRTLRTCVHHVSFHYGCHVIIRACAVVAGELNLTLGEQEPGIGLDDGHFNRALLFRAADNGDRTLNLNHGRWVAVCQRQFMLSRFRLELLKRNFINKILDLSIFQKITSTLKQLILLERQMLIQFTENIQFHQSVLEVR